jgi:hypothetical protein
MSSEYILHHQKNDNTIGGTKENTNNSIQYKFIANYTVILILEIIDCIIICK